MSIGMRIFLIIILMGICMFLSISEISLASARKLKLQVMADEGSKNALKVMRYNVHLEDFLQLYR